MHVLRTSLCTRRSPTFGVLWITSLPSCLKVRRSVSRRIWSGFFVTCARLQKHASCGLMHFASTKATQKNVVDRFVSCAISTARVRQTWYGLGSMTNEELVASDSLRGYGAPISQHSDGRSENYGSPRDESRKIWRSKVPSIQSPEMTGLHFRWSSDSQESGRASGSCRRSHVRQQCY